VAVVGYGVKAKSESSTNRFTLEVLVESVPVAVKLRVSVLSAFRFCTVSTVEPPGEIAAGLKAQVAG
jgi:hypothetical protein